LNGAGAHSLRTLVLAPSGRDAPLALRLLWEAGVAADICADLESLVGELKRGAGVAIIADEAVQSGDLRPLVDFLRAQPAWSDMPIILLTQRGGGPERSPATLRIGEILGNVSFLERPFHPATLTSLVRSAARGRRRQYEARSRLDEICEREQQLQTALTAGRLGSWTLDVGRMVFHASATSHAHFGIEGSNEFTYDDLSRLIHGDDRERMTRALHESLSSGADYVAEFRNVRPEGSIHWVDLRARALRDAAGTVVHLAGVSSDITARKSSELERERLLGELAVERTALSQLTRNLEQRVALRTGELMTEVAAREKAQEQLLQSQKMESVGKLTGGIAHDFNNLLMAVLGNLEILRKRLPNETGTRRLIDGAMLGAQRGASLTQRMLAFARQQDLKTASADIGALVCGMRELLRRSLGPQIALQLHIDRDLPPAEVDAHQVELAVLNLAINARDAMPDGGVIDIRVDQRQLLGEYGLRPGTYLAYEFPTPAWGWTPQPWRRRSSRSFRPNRWGKGLDWGCR
jgi:PAS domain S-box-containing protein